MRIQRRKVLKILGGAVATGVGFLLPGSERLLEGHSQSTREESAQVEPVVRSMDGPDPDFAGGVVVSKTSEGVVLKSDAGIRAVKIPSSIEVWKEFHVSPDVIALGDWVDARGKAQADGSLLADSKMVWVNIGRLNGTLVSTSTDSIQISTTQGIRTLELSSGLEVVSIRDPAVQQPLSDGIQGLSTGSFVGAVGLRLPDGGFRATRIWTDQ